MPDDTDPLDHGELTEGPVQATTHQSRFDNPSETVRAAMILLEEQEARLAALRAAVIAGESGQPSPFDINAFLAQNHADRSRQP